MSFTSKNIQIQNLRYFQLLIDLSSYRFNYLTKIPPKNQKEAIKLLSNDVNMTSLMNSIEKVGISVPLTVIKNNNKDDKFIILDGSRRYVALYALKENYLSIKKEFPIHFSRIPCIIVDKNEIEALSLSINVSANKSQVLRKIENIKYTDRIKKNYLEIKALQFKNKFHEAELLYSHLNYKNAKERDQKLKQLEKDNFISFEDNQKLLKAYEEFQTFLNIFDAKDPVFKNKFELSKLENYKNQSLDSKEENQLLIDLSDKYFDFFYEYAAIAKLYDFKYNNDIEYSFSNFFRKKTITKEEETDVIRQIIQDPVFLKFSLKNNANEILNKIKLMEYNNQNQSNDTLELDALIENHETKIVEFKSTFDTNLETKKSPDEITRFACLKAIASFINTIGGKLLIGVADNKEVIGIEGDVYTSDDHYKRKIENLLYDTLQRKNSNYWDISIKKTRKV